MKRSVFSITILVLQVLVLGATVVLGRTHASSEPLAELGTAFTYQGQLNQNGSPVNDNCDLRFGLWDALSGGSQVGSNQTVTNQTVSNGLFTVLLNDGNEFGNSPFNGQALWLKIEIRCPAGSGSYITLNPRQPLTAVPYAQGLRLPITADMIIPDNSSGLSITTDTANPSATNALLAETQTAGGHGVYGWASAGSGAGTGVYGQANSPNGYGMVSENVANGYAIWSRGPARQDRADGGWVKAMVQVYLSNINRCYNSQGSTPNSTPPCGFSLSGAGGDFTIDFNFTVNDRFISVVPYYETDTGVVIPVVRGIGTDTVRIRTYKPDGSLINSAFFLIIY